MISRRLIGSKTTVEGAGRLPSFCTYVHPLTVPAHTFTCEMSMGEYADLRLLVWTQHSMPARLGDIGSYFTIGCHNLLCVLASCISTTWFVEPLCAFPHTSLLVLKDTACGYADKFTQDHTESISHVLLCTKKVHGTACNSDLKLTHASSSSLGLTHTHSRTHR